MLKKIEKAEETHAGDKERLDYLRALKIVCNGMIAWCERLASGFEAAAKTAPDAARSKELTDTAAACRRLPLRQNRRRSRRTTNTSTSMTNAPVPEL